MTGPCDCRHCKAPALAAVEEMAHEPVQLPTEARLFRVHTPGLPPQDCVLHPDGRMSMEAGGQTLWSMVSFDDMREMNWRASHIEWDPAPLAEDPEPSAQPVAVQDAIPLTT